MDKIEGWCVVSSLLVALSSHHASARAAPGADAGPTQDGEVADAEAKEPEAGSKSTPGQADQGNSDAADDQKKAAEAKPGPEAEEPSSVATCEEAAYSVTERLCPRLEKAKATDLDAQVAVLCQSACIQPNVFCVETTTASPFCAKKGSRTIEGLPDSLAPGSAIIIRFFEPNAASGNVTVSRRLVEPRNTMTARDKEGPIPPPPPAPRFVKRRDDVVVKVPDETSAKELAVLIAWSPEKESGKTFPGASESYRIEIDHGMYYLEVGVMVPIVFGGERKVTLVEAFGERRVVVSEDRYVTTALALNFFPWGRRNNHISPWHPFRTWDLLGFQVAANLDLKNVSDHLYLGAVVEPISGFSLSVGGTMLKGEFIPPGYAEGMLVGPGETLEPEAKYMVRPYFGVTLTNELLTTVYKGAADIAATRGSQE